MNCVPVVHHGTTLPPDIAFIHDFCITNHISQLAAIFSDTIFWFSAIIFGSSGDCVPHNCVRDMMVDIAVDHISTDVVPSFQTSNIAAGVVGTNSDQAGC